MIICTCNTPSPSRLEKIKKYNMGVLCSTHPQISFLRSFLKCDLDGIPVIALDNGAFAGQGMPFGEFAFLESINEFAKNKKKVKLSWIVTPDIIAGGLKSLDFSRGWLDRLPGFNNFAIVIQDGMTPKDLTFLENDNRVSHLFLGGSKNWKWANLERFAEFSHSINKRYHVGGVGTLNRLNACKLLLNEDDSVDSTNPVRNNNFSSIREHLNPRQMSLI